MNILRWKRKSKNKIRFKTLILVIFSFIMTTFAWYAYSKLLYPTLNMHMISWDMEYYIGATKQTNPIGVNFSTLYPTMDEQTVTIDIKNNGESLADIEYHVESVTIAGRTYELIQQGTTPTSTNYIILTPHVLETDASGNQIYKDVITNDIERFPFTIEVEHSAQVQPSGQGYLKVTVNWYGDNSELDSEWGYIVGEYLESNPTATSVLSVGISIDAYQPDEDAEILPETLQSTSETTPYLPTGFTRVAGTNLETGLAIKDASGNEYVWIEVPRNSTVYATSGLDITDFTDTSSIETDLRAYSSDYGVDGYTDEYLSTVVYRATGLSIDAYNELKQKMLKSVYQNGGFYIGRYETGIEGSPRTSATTPSETPVIKQHAYPYNMVTCSQAQTLATNMESGDYTTSLMFGVQWNLVLKYLETKGVAKEELITDSTEWGNYWNNAWYITNPNAKYLDIYNEESYFDAPYEKVYDDFILLTTGASAKFQKQAIYDLVGNLWEMTLEYSNDASNPVTTRGGDFMYQGNTDTASKHNTTTISGQYINEVFRVTLY